MAVTVRDSQAAPSALTLNTNRYLNTASGENTNAAVTAGAPGIYVLDLDFNNARKGDRFTLKVELAALVGGSLRVFETYNFVNLSTSAGSAPAKPLWRSFPLMANSVGIKLTLVQTAGTGRVVPWELRTV